MEKFHLSLAVHTCKNCAMVKWFEEDIRFFILDESNEKIFMDILKLEDIFFENNIASFI